MKILIDAMGSDNAPHVEVEGCIQAIDEFGCSIVLVGDKGKIEEELKKYGLEHKIQKREFRQLVFQFPE